MTYYISPRRYHALRRWINEPTGEAEFVLPVDVREEDAAFVISAVVPGLKAEDINIQILEDVVTLEGARQIEDSAYLLRELPYGNFRRSLRLPVPVDGDAAEATVADGLLTLRLPKVEAAMPKTIKVLSK
jgi:HSP20 family protein